MKFLWQQIIVFLIVIFIALVIIATRIENYMTTNIEETRQEQLMNYGRNIVSNNFSREDLVRASQLLASESIIIQVYLPDGRTIYPTYDQRFNAELSDEDLAILNSDKPIGFRRVERLNSKGDSEAYLTVYFPHHDVGQFPDGFISLGAPLDDLEGQLEQVRINIYTSFMIAIFIGVLLSIFYAYFQTRKINKLQLATREIASGNYEIELDTSGKDEFGDLARDFKVMSTSLVESNEEIERQEELRRQFMMDVAHEMRTPLTTMSGLLEGLENDMIPENHRERSLELINRETKRLTRLVNENLDYEKILNRQVYLKKQSIDGNKLFEEIRQQMNVRAEENGDYIITAADADLVIWADFDRLRQIIINLLTNAIQFSENSEIKLVGYMHEDYAELQVIDQGIGISEDEIKSIWERFYKADVSRTNTKFGESGIGLSLVLSLVESHEGTIEVKSKLGEGSTFIVKLPHEGKGPSNKTDTEKKDE